MATHTHTCRDCNDDIPCEAPETRDGACTQWEGGNDGCENPDCVPSTMTVPLDAPTRAFFQGVSDGDELATSCRHNREGWLFYAGRAFGLHYGEDQSTPEALAYVNGLMTRKPS